MNDEPDFCCQRCGHKANMNFASRIKARHTIKWRIVPKEGDLLSADTVGGTLSDMSRLLKATSDSHGCSAGVFVSGMSFDQGAVEFELLITNIEKGVEPSSDTPPPSVEREAADA